MSELLELPGVSLTDWEKEPQRRMLLVEHAFTHEASVCRVTDGAWRSARKMCMAIPKQIVHCSVRRLNLSDCDGAPTT